MIIAYMWNKKKSTNELSYKTEAESQMQKTNYGYQGIKEGGDKWGDCD